MSRSMAGRHKHRSFGGKIGGNQHIVCHAIRHLADGGSRSRGYQHGICPQTEVHMAVPSAIALGKELTDNRFAGQGRERDRGNKFFSGRRNDHLHLCTTLNQSANNIACFIGGNAARNAQYYFLPFQYICHLFLSHFTQTYLGQRGFGIQGKNHCSESSCNSRDRASGHRIPTCPCTCRS